MLIRAPGCINRGNFPGEFVGVTRPGERSPARCSSWAQYFLRTTNVSTTATGAAASSIPLARKLVGAPMGVDRCWVPAVR